MATSLLYKDVNVVTVLKTYIAVIFVTLDNMLDYFILYVAVICVRV